MSTPKMWVPPRADKEAKFLCRLCGTRFITEAAMTRHVVAHGDDEIQAARARHKSAVDNFYGDGIDPEWERYNRALEAQGIDPEVQYNRGRKSGIRRASES